MVVHRYGYYLAVGQVTRIDDKTKKITMKMFTDDPVIGEVILYGERDLKYLSFYAPHLRYSSPKEGRATQYEKIKDRNAFNAISGYWNLPKVGDILLLAVYLIQPEGAKFFRQNTVKDVIVLGQIAWHNALPNQYDNMWLDQSGAKLHFNHNWQDNSAPDVPTGHTTLIGNRTSFISGKKFLGFGLFSHHYQKGIKKGDTPVKHDPFVPIMQGIEDNSSDKSHKLWSKMFTRNLEDFQIYNPDFTKKFRGLYDDKFLEPPAPPIDGHRFTHESGYSDIVYGIGNYLGYVRSRMKIIGSDYLKYAMAPDGKESFNDKFMGWVLENELAIQQSAETQSDTEDLKYTISPTMVTSDELNRRGEGLEEQVKDGIAIHIPKDKKTTLESARNHLDGAEEQAESGKYKILVGDNVEIIIDKAGTITITDGTRMITMNGSTVNIT